MLWMVSSCRNRLLSTSDQDCLSKPGLVGLTPSDHPGLLAATVKSAGHLGAVPFCVNVMLNISRPALAGSNSQSPIQTPRTSRTCRALGVAVVQAAQRDRSQCVHVRSSRPSGRKAGV